MFNFFILVMWAVIALRDICETQIWDRTWTRVYSKYNANNTIITSSPSTRTYYNPNPGYDAYWTDGHWIYGTTTTRGTGPTTSTMTRTLVCKKPCDIEYRYVGAVCAHRVDYIMENSTVAPNSANYSNLEQVYLDTNYIHMRTFRSYCEFLARQCLDHIWNYMSWNFLHFGACLTDIEQYVPVEIAEKVLDRKRNYLEQYNFNTARNTARNYNAPCHTDNMEYLDRTKYTGSCYRIVRLAERANWDDARDYCTKDGAVYIVLDDENEREIVKEIVSDLEISMILFTDFLRNGYWDLFRTSTGETFDEVGYKPGADSFDWVNYQDKWNHSIAINSTTVNYQLTYAHSKPVPASLMYKGWPFCEKRIRNNLIPDELPRPTTTTPKKEE